MSRLRLGLAFVAVLATSQASGQTPPAAPSGATARCRDGTYSFSAHRSGTCSHHDGVSAWLTDAQQVPDTALPMCGGSCGVERWTVKTLSDSSAGTVDLSDTVNTTIEELVALPRPPSLPRRSRANAVERTLYRVEARLLFLFSEHDHDYHLVLASPRDTTITMIAEVPEPSCAGACVSGFAPVYARVRQTLFDYLNSPQSPKRPLVRVTGVGFFDFRHGQRGVAPNAIELHPVLAVEFRDSVAATQR